jgi:hypothetical protein
MCAVLSYQHAVALEPSAVPSPSAPHTLRVTAEYWLSEAGRKVALLAGQDGRARQILPIDVPIARLHLIAVDARGLPRLKLQPRYERRASDEIIRIAGSPTYDAPPSLEDLYALAARNYELERLYEAQRAAVTARRLEAERELRARVTQAFLGDPAQRALPHPAPTPTRCFVLTERGRRLFDISEDDGVARELPPEAHRRFRADLRARRERNRETHATQRVLHDEKGRALGTWIAAFGTADQQARLAAGVLPVDEAIEAMTDHAFEAARDFARYTRDGASRLQTHLRQWSGYDAAVVMPADLVVASSPAPTATQGQWSLVQGLRAALPEAAVFLRTHRLSWRRDPQAPMLTLHSAVAVQKVGLFTLRREYAAPD